MTMKSFVLLCLLLFPIDKSNPPPSLYIFVVSIPSFMNEESIQSGHHAKKFENVQVKLSDYPNNALPLQNVDEDGHLKQCEDMVDLAFLHEVSSEGI